MYRPHSSILGNAEGTELFRNIKNFDNVSVHLWSVANLVDVQ